MADLRALLSTQQDASVLAVALKGLSGQTRCCVLLVMRIADCPARARLPNHATSQAVGSVMVTNLCGALSLALCVVLLTVCSVLIRHQHSGSLFTVVTCVCMKG